MEGAGTEVLFRDRRDIQPPQSSYEQGRGTSDNIYAALDPAQFVPCQEDIWQPLPKQEHEGGETAIKVRA